MYLIDTSVWIDYFREIDNAGTSYFIQILTKDIPFGITGIIYQEVLQGASSQKDFKKLSDYLSGQYFFHPENEVLSYQKSAKLYFDCRRKGITIRSTIDCLIALIAIENDLTLLHNDKDFAKLKKVAPNLKLV